MYPIYGPGQPDYITDPDQLMGPLASDRFPNTMNGMWSDFRQRANPYYGEDFNPYGMNPLGPAAPMMLGVSGPPPPPMLTGGGMEPPQSKPGGGDSGGFDWSQLANIALPLGAGAAGFMAGIAPQGNPQTVLQGLSLAHRAQMMPRPDQQAALQRQKFIQELIASGNATEEGLMALKQQYPHMATEIDAVMPHARDQGMMRSKMRSMMGLEGQSGPGAPPPPPGSAQSPPQLGGSGPGPGYDMLPSMQMGADGKMSMTMSPHQRPQPHRTDTDNALQGIQVINQQLSAEMQKPNPDQNLIQQYQTARQALLFGLRGKPMSAGGQAAYDRRFMSPDADSTEAQTLNTQMVGAGRLPMETDQGKAHEDIRMESQGLGRTNADPQLASLQQVSDTRDLAGDNKDVAQAVSGAAGVMQAEQQFGSDDPRTKAAQAATAQKGSKPGDVMQLGGQYRQAAGDFNTTRDFYRQVETVLSSGNPNAMADISFITAMAKILDPGSVVRPSESGMVQVDSRTLPDELKLRLENWINQPQLLTPQQRFDLVNTVRQAYYSRLKTHGGVREGFEATSKSLFPDRPTSDVTGTVPLDAVDMAYLRGRPATMADVQTAKERAATLGQPALAPWILLKQGINPFADITQ